MTISPITIKNLCAQYLPLPGESSKLKGIEELVDQLYKQGKEAAEKLSEMSEQEIDANAVNIPHSIAYKLIEVVALDSIQSCDSLKHALSKASRIYMELTLFMCAFTGRRLYTRKPAEALDHIKEVIKTLKSQEIITAQQLATHFELKRCKESLKALETGRGKWKEVYNDHKAELLEGLLCSILSVGPSASGAPLVPLVGPIIRLVARIYHEWGKNWHSSVWALEWSMAKTTTLDQFKQLQEHQSQMTQIPTHKHGHKMAFALSGTLYEMIITVSSAEFKSRLVREFLPILDQKADKFWKARFRTLDYLIPLYDHLNNQVALKDKRELLNAIAEKLFSRLPCENYNPSITYLVRKVSEELYKKNSQTIQGVAKTIDISEAQRGLRNRRNERSTEVGKYLAGIKSAMKIPSLQAGGAPDTQDIDKAFTTIRDWKGLGNEAEIDATIQESKNDAQELNESWNITKQALEQQQANIDFLQQLIKNGD